MFGGKPGKKEQLLQVLVLGGGNELVTGVNKVGFGVVVVVCCYNGNKY